MAEKRLKGLCQGLNRFLNSQNIYLRHGKPKNNGPVLSFITNCYIRALELLTSVFGWNGEDGNGLQLEKSRLNVSISFRLSSKIDI